MDLHDVKTERAWNSGKEKISISNRECDKMNLRNKELITWVKNKNKNYIMLILHQFKLMTSSGFGILLILVERIKIHIA